MPTVMVHGVESSVWQGSSPTYTQILDALQPIAVLNNATGRDLGGWVGPRPRVVRVIQPLGTASAWLTHFAWPYSWPDATPDDTERVTRTLLATVNRQLGAQSADWQNSIVAYSPAVNGPLSDWQSGALSVTQTQDIWPTLGGRLDASENPVGPTTAATHPGTAAAAAGSAMARATDFFKAVWPLAAIGVGVYVADRLGAFKPRKPKRLPSDYGVTPAGARSNPDYRFLNPRPPEWDQYTPSHPYPCKPWEAGIVGLQVPGRGGGTVTSCATPAEPALERGESTEHWHARAVHTKRRKGQVQIGLPGVGPVMPKARARARIRRAGMETYKTPLEDVAQAAAAYSGSMCPLPYAPGLEFPHTVSKCDPEHKLWKGYADALADAQERASIEAPESAGPNEFECLIRQALETDPRFAAWDAAAAQCARGFESRQSSRKGKAVFSQQRERAQTRARLEASSDFDITSAEYTDTLRSAERKGRRR